MTEVETLGILDEIQTLVSDNLQVVSYKWLSRNFLVSSNTAKRLLQDFVEKNEGELEVVFTLAGWLKKDSSVYHIRLVSRSKFEEAKREFSDNCSVHVYSVQACIPKDPASLWNAEFLQAEELFKQPLTVDNCLLNNRLSGVFNSYVKRNSGTSSSSAGLPAIGSIVTGPSRGGSATAHQTTSVPQPTVGDVKNGSHYTGAHEQSSTQAVEKASVPEVPADKKKGGQNDKRNSATGGSLTSMWVRASAKSKSTDTPSETKNTIPNADGCAEAETCAREAVNGRNSDDDRDINFKRASNGEGNRKRRVVFDFSDEEDDYKDAVNLASPDLPKAKSSLDSKHCSKTSGVDKSSLSSYKLQETKPKEKEENYMRKELNQLLGEESLDLSKVEINGISSSDKTHNSNSEKAACPKDKPTAAASNSSNVTKGKNGGICSSTKIQSSSPKEGSDVNDKTIAASNSPKRRKVLKTRIDERGREVTEVVWEGDEAEVKARADDNAMNKASINTIFTDNRPPAAKKSPAVGVVVPPNPPGKAGHKKGGSKDPKQVNIMSFFKKV